jgi:hypothetical protein
MNEHVRTIRMLASNGYLWNSQGERFTHARFGRRTASVRQLVTQSGHRCPDVEESRAEGRSI